MRTNQPAVATLVNGVLKAEDLHAKAIEANKKRLVVLGCSKRKLKQNAPASRLYQGALFKAGMRFARDKRADAIIISAKYGLVNPADPIDPYDEVMTGPKATQFRKDPAIAARLQALFALGEYDQIWVLAGGHYLSVFPSQCVDDRFVMPLQDLGGIGKVLQFLNREGA